MNEIAATTRREGARCALSTKPIAAGGVIN